MPRNLFVAAVTLVASSAVLSCGSGSSKTTPPTTTAPDFSNLVFIGDSLTAGFQNGSLLDTQQPNGYAALLAAQLKTSIKLPLIAAPGAPAVLELVSVGPPPVVRQASGTTTGRDDTSVQPTDLAVPGHKLTDLINAAPTLVPTTAIDVITNLILGFPLGNTNTQLEEAVALKPTAVVVWVGNNDVLVADSSGVTSGMTDVASFTTQFTQMMTTLKQQTKAAIVVANLPDVTSIPLLTPAPAVIAELATMSSLPSAQVATLLGISNDELVNATGLKEAQKIISDYQKGTTDPPLDDAGFLTAAEIAIIQQRVKDLNTVIAQQASANGATLVDTNGFFASLANGVTLNGYKATTAFLGGLFSLDGEHPTNTGYALLANRFIDTINTTFGTTYADVDASAVAAKDPYFGPNIKPVGATFTIPVSAARQSDWLNLNAKLKPHSN